MHDAWVLIQALRLRLIPVATTLLLLIGATFLSGCRSCLPRSDAERAKEEREEVHQQLNSSLLVLPYRGLKTVLRASALTPPPPQITEVVQILNQVSAELQVERPDLLGQSKQLLSLASAIYRSGAILFREEEDRYPLLWQTAKAGPLPATWYDAQTEHLFVGMLDMLIYVTGRQKPLIDWVYYEFDRAEPQPAWPQELQLLAQQTRGLMFMVGAKHYAAEEEFTGYLETLRKMSAKDIQQLQVTNNASVEITGESYHKGLRAAGHLSRSFNRFALKRDERGYEDLEVALKLVRELGMDNELTDWAELSLALHKKDYPKASQLLTHLAQSPYLTEEERIEVKGCAESMSKLGDGFVLFGRNRALLVVARAALARVGGVKTLLAVFAILIGPERAAKVARPTLLLWGVGTVLAEDAQQKGKETVDKGKQLGQKGYQLLRQQVDKLSD